MTDHAEPNSDGDSPDAVDFHYIKGAQFRAIHVDGVFGGVAPNGNITLALYNERFPIPLRIRHGLNSDQTLGPEQGRMSREGIVREVDAELVMNRRVAESLVEWLSEKIKQARRADDK